MRDLSSNRPLSSNDVDKAIVETREKVNGSCLIVFVLQYYSYFFRFVSMYMTDNRISFGWNPNRELDLFSIYVRNR